MTAEEYLVKDGFDPYWDNDDMFINKSEEDKCVHVKELMIGFAKQKVKEAEEAFLKKLEQYLNRSIHDAPEDIKFINNWYPVENIK